MFSVSNLLLIIIKHWRLLMIYKNELDVSAA